MQSPFNEISPLKIYFNKDLYNIGIFNIMLLKRCYRTTPALYINLGYNQA